MAQVQRNGYGTSSVGSTEDDSMSGSDSSSPNSLMDFQGQPGQILLHYDGSMGQFTEAGLAKPVPIRRSDKRGTEARTYVSAVAAYDALNQISTFSSDSLDGNPLIIRAITALNPSSSSRRQRSEKKPIPVEQKDDKYFERRRRNNVAAKKSRDYRKAREDDIAMRASYLEKENAVLKAQLSTLRDEAEALKNMLVHKRNQHQVQQQHQQQQQQQQQQLNRFMGLTALPAHIQV